MTSIAIDTRVLLKDYFDAIGSQPKSEQLMDHFISDERLKEHIRQAEAAFPGYQVIPQQILVEGDWAACRMTLKGTHKGEFAGIPATGRAISSDFVIFYRFEDGRIAEHYMQLDAQDLVRQLTA